MPSSPYLTSFCSTVGDWPMGSITSAGQHCSPSVASYVHLSCCPVPFEKTRATAVDVTYGDVWGYLLCVHIGQNTILPVTPYITSAKLLMPSEFSELHLYTQGWDTVSARAKTGIRWPARAGWWGDFNKGIIDRVLAGLGETSRAGAVTALAVGGCEQSRAWVAGRRDSFQNPERATLQRVSCQGLRFGVESYSQPLAAS